jgi:hypothetical protein
LGSEIIKAEGIQSAFIIEAFPYSQLLTGKRLLKLSMVLKIYPPPNWAFS